MNVEPRTFADGLDVDCERNIRVSGDFRVFVLSNGKECNWLLVRWDDLEGTDCVWRSGVKF